MQKAIIHFVISALIGLGIGYIAFQVIGGKSDGTEKNVAQTESKASENSTESNDQDKKAEEAAVTVNSEDTIFSKKGCLQCHSIEALDLKGGAVGPDLSQAYNNVEGKHGKPINEFLKKPTSAVMSGVIGNNPLSDDEINQVLELLKEAASK